MLRANISDKELSEKRKIGLNPCYSGCYARIDKILNAVRKAFSVLILVIVDVTRELLDENVFQAQKCVLILVIVDVTREFLKS